MLYRRESKRRRRDNKLAHAGGERSEAGSVGKPVGIAKRRPGSLAERPRVMGALGLGGTGAHALAVRLSAIL